MPLSKQTVMLPEEMVTDIQQVYLSKGKSVHGSVQKTLLRGAELALAELRSVPQSEQVPGTGPHVAEHTTVGIVQPLKGDVPADTLTPRERELQNAIVALARTGDPDTIAVVELLLKPFIGVQVDDKQKTSGSGDPGRVQQGRGKTGNTRKAG
jgi:hypothetical protein